MFTRAPIYLLLVILSTGYLVGSNLVGWTPALLFAARSAVPHGAPVRHK